MGYSLLEKTVRLGPPTVVFSALLCFVRAPPERYFSPQHHPQQAIEETVVVFSPSPPRCLFKNRAREGGEGSSLREDHSPPLFNRS